MAARRSSFRFRLPWSRDEPPPPPPPPPAPATQPSTRPNAGTAPSPATRPAAGSQPAAWTSANNLSRAETPTNNQPPNPTRNATPSIPTSPTKAGTLDNNQLPNTKTSTTPTPSISPPRPIESSTPSTSQSPATPTTAGSSTETRTPTQASNMSSTSTNSPARPTSQTTTSNPTTPKVAQRPPFRPAGAAPSPKNRASKNESQPSSPSQATNKSRNTSQPASPSGAANRSRASQSQSPSRSAPQSPAMTPTSSPTRKAPHVLSSKAGQESSNSPSVVKSQMHEKNQETTLPTSPPQSLHGISKPSSKSIEADKEATEQMELRTKKETKSDADSEAKIRFTDKAMQPSEESVPKSTITGITKGPSEKSDSSSISGEPKMLKESDTNNQETKEVVQESRRKDYGAGERTPEVQSKQEGSSKDQVLKNSGSNGRQTRTTTTQPRNKTVVSGSSHKTVVSNEAHIPIHKEIKDNISKVLNRVAVGDDTQKTGKTPVNVITLAGDNRGASMQLGSDSSTKGGRIHIHRGYKINPDESADTTTDGEGSPKDSKTKEDQTIAAYINCNVQGINNSIVFNSSITERDPGVHMSIPSEPVHSSLFDAHKAEVNVTPARTIRRRCLRGLFLESSDSDPDKPRRHGCRVGCNEKKKITR
ncbi:uncharacterized protein LOC107797249 [Nicotiana tabacum]|uniref:Cell wall protein DAN4-like n=1 Tax=Nicotiana tabacum TaxID=4097 RepID=A0A1S4AGQ4_TOBAC|nr:cell wall protein DAN4-like [Nicotiana tomentosiformis]XP_016475608.1 PREDICTED: cell wall protein DAN4-like [Nicotiana tabacum]